MLIDTHAHLDEQSFETDLDDVLLRAKQHGVESILTIGVTAESCVSAVKLAKEHPQLHAVVAIHPNYVSTAAPDDFDLVSGLASDPHVVAVGETGLDRYWDYSPLELQQAYFHRHIELSRRVDKPFIVHCRDAEEEMVALLREEFVQGPLVGVVHSFCGSAETATACLEMGMHLSFAGMLTFKSNQALRDVAKSIPLDRVLVETDSPYLAPVPMRGKRNEPAFVAHTAKCLGEIHGLSLEEIGSITTGNAKRLFQLK